MDIDLKNQVNLYDPLWIFLLALMTNVFSEFLSWMFIYRTKKYINTKKLIDTLTKKIEDLTKKMEELTEKTEEEMIEELTKQHNKLAYTSSTSLQNIYNYVLVVLCTKYL